MGKLLLVLAAVLGGVVVWRRKSLQSDAEMLTELAKTNAAKASEAAKSGVAKVKKESADAEQAVDEAADEAADAASDEVAEATVESADA